MVALDVDFDVFKALTMRRTTESVSYNDVLRQLLEIENEPPITRPEALAWSWKGVTLPHGTELRAVYKGKEHTAEIINGEWVQNGEKHGSPSAAAFSITQSGINGWWFWAVKRPSDPAWMPLHKLRGA